MPKKINIQDKCLLDLQQHPVHDYNAWSIFVNVMVRVTINYHIHIYFYSIIKWKENTLSKLTGYNCKSSIFAAIL